MPRTDDCADDVAALSTSLDGMSTFGRCAARIAAVRGILESATNQLRVAKRLAPRRGATLAERFGRLDDRIVFVVGSPRSGTTFLAGAIGSLPGFVDLGEVAPVKAAVPELATLPPNEAAARLRRILAVSRRVGLVGAVRPVEQTPELAHLVAAIPLAYPRASVVHIIRDGRDVVSSLLEKPWLRREQTPLRRRGAPVRVVRALLGRAGAARRVRDRERREASSVGVAELRHSRTLCACAADRDLVRGPGCRPVRSRRSSGAGYRRTCRPARHSTRTRSRDFGRPASNGLEPGSAGRRRGRGGRAAPRARLCDLTPQGGARKRAKGEPRRTVQLVRTSGSPAGSRSRASSAGRGGRLRRPGATGGLRRQASSASV